MLSGVSHLAIDNCIKTVSGDLLDQAITEARITLRILKLSVAPEIDNIFMFTATGNNLTFTEDAIRRWLVCELESLIEHPEEVLHSFDFLQEVLEQRAELIVAALTIFKAYIGANRPGVKELTPFGSFEKWSQDVRGPLGEEDPYQSIDVVR
jgi:hypothetical protein